MNFYATTVRMLHSGLVLRDSIIGDDVIAAHARHDKLVTEMAGIVRGTSTQTHQQGQVRSTISVGGKPLIEVCTA